MKYKILDENDRTVGEKDLRKMLFKEEIYDLVNNMEDYFEGYLSLGNQFAAIQTALSGSVAEVVSRLESSWSYPIEKVYDEWTLFRYEHGGNPYVAKTEEEKQKILKKYIGKVVQLSDREYFVKE